MGGVRARKARRNRRVNTTKVGAKRKKKSNKLTIDNPVLKKQWDKTKTLKQNLKSFGLAADPNDVVMKTFAKSKSHHQINPGTGSVLELLKNSLQRDVNDDTEIEESKQLTEVVAEFEEQAKHGKKTERIISEGEAKFLIGLLNDHGDNYKAMARDKRNSYQHTPKQLKRKCENFLASSYYDKYVKEDQAMDVE